MIDEVYDDVEEPYEKLALWISLSLKEEWAKYSDLHGETVPVTIRRLYRRAIQEQADFDRSRERFPS
jgi:hypothetical protein